MAWNIQTIFDFLDFQIRKQRNGFITISEGMAALDHAQMEKLEDDFKLYGVSQTIHDSLKPFKVIQYQFTSNASGQVTYPNDYVHFLSGLFTVYGSTVNQVQMINPDEKSRRLTSQLRPVTLSNPIAEDSATGFQLYPQQQQTGFYNYLRRPAVPVYAYTQSGRTIIYDPANSVQLEWSDSYIDNIISRALAYLGINMAERDIIEFSQLKQQQTNSN